jgi:16S rRNA (uracil1498-N3)-methyltransferase
MRKTKGDQILCFDGGGSEFDCTIINPSTNACEIMVVRQARKSEPPTPRLHVALGLLKGQPMDRALQQACESGATDVWLLHTSRSNVALNKARMSSKLAHWHKVLASSTEQCGSLFVPTLHPLASIAQTLEGARATPMVFDPGGCDMPQRLDPADRLLLIGPEGGWNEAELELFSDRGIPRYRLGNLTFRAETAPSVTLALVQRAQGWRTNG